MPDKSTEDIVENKTEASWSKGGEYVYGDDELSEGLYALEDEAVILDGIEGKYIPYYRMQDVMILYRERLRKHTQKLINAAESEEREKTLEILEKLKITIKVDFVETVKLTKGEKSYNKNLKDIQNIIKKN